MQEMNGLTRSRLLGGRTISGPIRSVLGVLLVLLSISIEVSAQSSAPLSAEQQKRIGEFGERFFKARPKTKFEDWDPAARGKLMDEAATLGAIPEGGMDDVVTLLWKSAARFGPRLSQAGKTEIPTPYGDATFIMKGAAGRDKALLIGLHGGGEGAGSAGEAAGNWSMKNSIGFYPQGIRLVHDTWNTVHGEKFILTLIEIGKAQFGIDPDRVYTMGFSMGGTGSWFMAGRHPDLLAGSTPAAGVLMASPKSQIERKEDVEQIQHGMVPNVRNLAMWYYIGLADRNCMPGTYLFVADILDELKKEDPTGWSKVNFSTYEKLAHAFPPGEPSNGIKYLEKERRDTFPKKIVWEYATDPQPLPDAEDKTTRYQKKYFYWLKTDPVVDRQSITAEIKGNVIDLHASRGRYGTEGITIFLNPKMIDVQKEVVVTVKGNEVYRGKPTPDFRTIVETLDEKLDRSMVFDRRIELR